MNHRLATMLRATVLVSSSVGCATDDSGPRFPVESGLEQTRSLESLSPIEAAALCVAENEGLIRFSTSDVPAEYLCTLDAAFDAMSTNTSTRLPFDVAQCESKRMACLRGQPNITATVNCDSSSIPAPCRVSVRDVETCSERYLETLADEWQAVSCATLAKLPQVSIPVSAKSPSDLPGCEHLKSDCPERGWITLSVTRKPAEVTVLDRRFSLVRAPASQR